MELGPTHAKGIYFTVILLEHPDIALKVAVGAPPDETEALS
jgi:hypothetical protein